MTSSAFSAGHAPKTVVDIAVGSDAHTTLVAAVKAAGLVDTLMSEGPFTVFAPVNDAFAALPAGTVDNLLKPENKATLTKVLTAHVVSGNISSAMLVEKIKAHHGRFNFTTVSGDALTATLTPHGNVWIFDESGSAAQVTAADLEAGNGVVHVVSKVLLPK
ncbi:MAG: fasciclin domain-containing protein [Nitratireductor sp.]